MKYSVKLSHAVHILVFIYLSEGLPLSSDKIAESIHTNPGCVRQIMSVTPKCGNYKKYNRTSETGTRKRAGNNLVA